MLKILKAKTNYTPEFRFSIADSVSDLSYHACVYYSKNLPFRLSHVFSHTARLKLRISEIIQQSIRL